VFLLEATNANGGKAVRELLDKAFSERRGWEKRVVGDIDWIKDAKYNDKIIARLGVEVQVSARSDLVIRDLIHLRNNLQLGKIDAGAIVVPTDRMAVFLPSRAPSFSQTIKYIEDEFREAQYFPLLLIGIEHDGPATEPLAKQKRIA
jgi:Restriction endonuclease BglII